MFHEKQIFYSKYLYISECSLAGDRLQHYMVYTVYDHLMLCRLQMTEAALALSEQKNHNMGELLAQSKVEKEEQRERWSREKKKEQEVWTH